MFVYAYFGMQGLLLFTLSRSDQSDECRSHSPFSAGAHSDKLRFDMIWICGRGKIRGRKFFFEGKTIREIKVLTVSKFSLLDFLFNLNSSEINTQCYKTYREDNT